MKKQLFLLAAILAMASSTPAWAYTFSAVAPSGQTLYYNIVSGHAEVVRPGTGSTYNNYVTGNLVIPASVTFNGTTYPVTALATISHYGSFEGCGGLTSVTIPNSVTSIGNYAFHNCSGLTSVTIPNSVTTIGISAFSGCRGLTSVTIPNSVTSIGSYAFSNCTGLTSVTIPNSVTSIGSSAFSNVRHIEYYGSATGSPWGAISMNGVTEGDFVYSDATKHNLVGYVGNGGNVIIPSNVETIGNKTFYGCSGLISVTIGNSVTSIGSSAFSGCTSLTSVTIPNSVTSIGSSAFEGCTSLTSITIGSGVTSIGSYAFNGCSGLISVTIPNSVTSIGNSAFEGCTGLTSVTIPNSVTSIGSSAFSGCTGLTSVTIGSGVTSIGSYAFNGCTSLTSVTIPDGVTSIGESAFRDCTSLTYVTIGSGVTSIGSSAFYNCTSLTSVTIPNSVTSIGYSAFRNCTGLTSVTIGNSVTSITNYAFSGCTSLTSTIYTGTIVQWCGISFGESSANPLYYSHSLTIGGTEITNLVIPNGVTEIKQYAFYNCTGLTSVTIPNSVTSIGYSAFSNVRHIEYYGSATGSPWGALSMNGVTEGDFVYSDATKRNLIGYVGNGGNVIIPSNVETIGNKTFYGCTGLTSITIGSGVTSIGSSAFRDCTSLTSVTIPNSVTSIGSSAFSGCRGLTSVTIPNSVTSIDSYAFSGCTGLTSTIYTGTIAQWCGVSFGGSSANPLYYSHSLTIGGTEITNLVIPNGVTEIKQYAFYNCTSLTSVTIGSGVTSIGSYAFSGCTGLTSVTIPNSVTSIGNYAFSGCTGLTSVTIPNSVTSISNYAFSGCTGLTSVTIPNSVTTIGSYAFSGCSGLTEMWMKPATPPTLGNVSSICDSIIDLIVPRNAYTAYTNAGTNYTRHRIHNDTIFVVVNVNDTSRGRVICEYDSVYPYPSVPPDTITLTAIANYGYHFTRWSDNATENIHFLTEITQDIVMTAYFDTNQYTITLSADSTIHGTVSGGGSYNYLSNRTITATPNYGYHFTHWNDGVSDNPRTITLSQDTTFTAQFANNTYTLTFQSATDLGIVDTTSVSGEYLNSTSLIFAIPIPHYHFIQWNDGNTENPRRFVFDDNKIYTAYFAIDVHAVDVQVDNLAHGSVSGAGNREYGQPITVSATPYSGYSFTHWSNGSTYNPYTFAVLQDLSLTAFFVADGEPWQDTVVLYDTINVDVHDTTYIDVHDTTYIPYAVHDTTYIDVHDTTYINVHDTTYIPYAVHDTTYIDVHDTTYIDVPYAVHDTTYIDVHDTTYIDVPYAVHDTTYIEVHDTTYIDIPYAVHDTTYIEVHDTTYIDVPYAVHDTTIVVDTLTVTQFDTITNTVYDTIDNYIYDTLTLTDTLWLTQFDTIWLHDTVIIHDTVYITHEAINGVEALNAKVYSSQGQIVVEGADGNRVTLYDVNGRILATKQDDYTPLYFDAPVSGTYMIKIGAYPARKVVVIR